MKNIWILSIVCAGLMGTACLAAETTTKPADSKTSKIKVAIGTFENKTNLPDEEVRSFTDMITTAMVKARKFEILERARIEEALKEQAMGEMGMMDGKTAQKLGNLLGCDFILIGSLTEAGISEKVMGTGAFAIAKTKAYLSVDIRILDAETGSIKIAETVRVEKDGPAGMKSEKISFSQGDTGIFGQVSREASQNVVNLTCQTIFPIRVIGISKDVVMLNYGSSSLKECEIYEVFSEGEAMTDPDTGEILGQEETKVGVIKIKSTEAKFSKAEFVEGKEKIQKGMICRKVKENPDQKKPERENPGKKLLW